VSRENEAPKGPILFRWTPSEAERGDVYSDCAEEYVVTDRPDVPGGCIIYGLYDGGRWIANATALRPLVRHLIEKNAAKTARDELERLTACLHAAKAHPDFSYVTVPIKSAVQIREILLAGGGWELNKEADVAPGDESWRRRIAP